MKLSYELEIKTPSPYVRESEFRIPGSFACWIRKESGVPLTIGFHWQKKSEIQNPGLWNPEHSSRNPKSHWLLESEIQVPLKKNPESESITVLDFLTWGDLIESIR